MNPSCFWLKVRPAGNREPQAIQSRNHLRHCPEELCPEESSRACRSRCRQTSGNHCSVRTLVWQKLIGPMLVGLCVFA